VLGDPEKTARYCSLLIAEVRRGMDRIEDAVAARDLGAIREAAHSLKGTTLPVKGSDASRLAETLEADADAGREARLPEDLARLRVVCGQLCEILTKGQRTE